MKQILIASGILCVFTVAIFGCLLIFDVMSVDTALSNMLKIVAAIVLLGGCSALITFLVATKKEPPA